MTFPHPGSHQPTSCCSDTGDFTLRVDGTKALTNQLFNSNSSAGQPSPLSEFAGAGASPGAALLALDHHQQGEGRGIVKLYNI